MKLSVVYFSVTGRTEKMAQAIANGMRKVENVEVELISISDYADKKEEIDACINESKGVVVGTPDYYAGEAWQVKQWLDTSTCRLSDKLCGAFCSANNPQGGTTLAIQNVLIELLSKGAIIYSGGVSHGVPMTHVGPVCLRDTEESGLAMSEKFGETFAQKAMELF